MKNETNVEAMPVMRRMKPEETKDKPVKEQCEKRTRGSKMFSLGENVYQAVMYPEAVHFQDKSTGEWKEIDNTLIHHEMKAKGQYLANKSNGDLKVELYGAQDKQMVCLTDDEKHSISWLINEAADVFPEIEARESDPDEEKDPRQKVMDTLDSSAIYKEILPGIDLRCILHGGSFKDEMVFKTPEALRPITMYLSVPGLKAEQAENSELRFIDEQKNTVFKLPAPYMRNAQENDFGDVKVRFEQETQNTWHVTYTPDMDWAKDAAYPIVLDPAVVTKNIAATFEDNYVTSKKPNYTYPYNNTNLPVCIGDSTYGTAYSYLKFLPSSLPTISASYYVTKAYLYTSLKTSPSTNTTVYVREVLSDWSSQTITYNSQPLLADKLMEYRYYSANCGINGSSEYDISNLVRKWYTGNNYGVRFELTSSGSLSLHSSDSAYHKPYLVINFVSLAGVQDGLEYEEQSVGRAGTGHVGLYNGNLIFTHQDTSMNGNILPISISHVYNSCYYKKNPFGTGMGWTVSAQQYLHRESLPTSPGSSSTTTYYVYTDDTGARHFFKQKSGKWKDLSGLSLELTISGNEATIKDKSDTCMIFDLPTVDFEDDDESTNITAYANIKPLKRIVDACGNTARFITDANRRITQITDGAERDTYITQNGNQIVTITEPGAPAVNYTYINGYLRQIAYNDLDSTLPVNRRTAYYEYYESVNGTPDPREGLLKSVTNIDGLTLTYDYTETVPHRVSSVVISNNGTVFGGRRYEYKDCLTVVTDRVVQGNALVDGKKLFYHFNDNGNVVSVNDELGYGCFAKYTDDMPTNHPEVLSRLQRSVVNLLKNHHLETATNWTNQSLSGATGSYANSTAYCYLGEKSLAMTRTNTSGQLTSYQTVSITKGKTYTFSAYYRTTSNAKAKLKATYMNASGNEVSVTSQALQSTDEWDRLSVTFEVPANSTSNSVTVRLMAVDDTGAVYFDCVQLEEGAVANPYNLLENGDFTFNVNGKPQAWLENSNNTTDTLVYAAPTGTKPQGLSSNTMRIYGPGRSKNPGIYQDIKVIGSKNDVFSAGGWSFNYSKPRNGQDKLYCIRVAFLKSGTSSTRVNSPSIEWSEEWTDWQYAAGPVIAPCNYTSIRFNVDYEKNINYAEFGGLFLYKEEFGQTYAYDENENITSVKNLASQQSHATYDDYNNVLTYRRPGRSSDEKYTLDWGSTTSEKKKHQLKKSTSPMGYIQEYTYDEYGNVSSSQLHQSIGTSRIIQTNTLYTEDGNYPALQTDARGNHTTSTYNTTTGTLTKVEDPNGQEINYNYDASKRIISVATTVNNNTSCNTYQYVDDKLTQVSHNTTTNTPDVVYKFEYDSQARPTYVKVGTQTLSKTEYNNDGTVSEIIYGNNTQNSPQSIQYTYDEFKRPKSTRYNGQGTDAYIYEYGANGQVGQLKDNLLNRRVNSEYDTAGRPMRIANFENGVHLYTGTVKYDEFNNLSVFNENVGEDRTPYKTEYLYESDDAPLSVMYGDTNNKVLYVNDNIGRVCNRTLTINGNNYGTAYHFVAGSNGDSNTTCLISKIEQTGETCEYTYDNVGNIASVKRGTLTTSYVYDALNQLIRVNDQSDTTSGASGTTWTYEYDRGGNILNKRRYYYSTETLGTALQTIPYTYDDDWKDQLKTYNGQNLYHDTIGNLTDDGTWEYTWEHGRQLKQMESSGKTINFAYNQDGLRVRKTVSENNNTIVTNYILHGKNIVHMTRGTDQFHFFYDAQNRPAIVEYNSTKYGYIHNLQGDVLGLIDSAGNEVVRYVYDSWGKILNVSGTMASSLGKYQPFRYRGYVYDVETGLYYLQSRYYNYNTSRFITSDNYINVKSGVLNLYHYCNNEPISYTDHNGHLAGTLALKLFVECFIVLDAIVSVGFSKLLSSAYEQSVKRNRSSFKHRPTATIKPGPAPSSTPSKPEVTNNILDGIIVDAQTSADDFDQTLVEAGKQFTTPQYWKAINK